MQQAEWITHPNYVCRQYQNPWGEHGYALGRYNHKSLPFEPYDGILTLKKEFSLSNSAQVERVTLCATALGIFDLFFNGNRVGTKCDGEVRYNEFQPGWTDYRKRVFSETYDLTDQVREQNLLVAEVSPGWWSGRISYGVYGFPPCAFWAELEIVYTNGARERLVTDGSWQASVCGPVLRADIWDGEYYDARIPHAAQNPDAHPWEKAKRFDGFSGTIVARQGPPVRAKKELERVPVCAELVRTEPDSREDPVADSITVLQKEHGTGCEKVVLKVGQSLILDFGQNLVGRPILQLSAERGTHVKLFFAELRNGDGGADKGNDGSPGSLYMSNYRSALSRIVYVASGCGMEVYFPRHSFFGFRYLEIEADREMELFSVRGEVLGADLQETSGFSCDNEEVNRLYSNAVWGMRGNYLSVPTDCPQRDERFGWAGDAQIFCGAASYLADIRSFLRKWLADLRDTQDDFDGAYGDVAPCVLSSPVNAGNAAWADAGLLIPYRLWLMYGETEPLAEHYASMERYMAYLRRYGLEGPKDLYGDWLGFEETDKRYLAICYYARDAYLMALFSRILHRSEREAHYLKLHQAIVAHWQTRYLCNGRLTCTSQTAYLAALAFDLLPEEARTRAVRELQQKVEENGFRLSTGFVGTGMLCQTLSSVGLHDLCYDLLLQTGFPSWLYSVRQGATTLWERWNSYTKEDGFGDVEMNSFNHYAYGAVVEWFLSGICGILPDEAHPGFSHFFLCPSPDLRAEEDIPEGQKRICRASGYYDSVKGRISSAWEYHGATTVYQLEIPAGANATVKLICADDRVILNGQCHSAEELQAHRERDRLCFSLPAGNYCMETVNPIAGQAASKEETE